jgi:hypothetical protein
MSSEHKTGTRIAELTRRLAALDRECAAQRVFPDCAGFGLALFRAQRALPRCASFDLGL